MRQWNIFHSPPGTEHITVGAGDAPCVILMFGSPAPEPMRVRAPSPFDGPPPP